MHYKNENRTFIFDRPKKISVKYVIKRSLLYCKQLYYNMLFQTVHTKPVQDTKYNVSICAIFKDEADYLKEWIEFHKIVGVEHFYLYNNMSSDNYLEVLEPYMQSGEVTLTDWEEWPVQMPAYSDCVKKYKQETKWIAFVDIDEFIVPNVCDKIYDFLKKFDSRYPVVVAYWRCFGTSGKLERKKEGLVTEDFTVSWKKYTDIGKCFYNTRFDYADDERVNKTNVHGRWGKYKNTLLPPVNCYGKVCIGDENPVGKGNMPIQINHYLLKSYGEYINKKRKRGGPTHSTDVYNMDYFYWHETKCQGADYHIYKYMIQLKLNLQREQ